MLFPRLNNLSFWLYFIACLFIMLCIAIEEGIGIGWTLYPTLICVDFHSSCACDIILFSIHLLGFSSIINSLNICGTLFVCRSRFFYFLFISLFFLRCFDYFPAFNFMPSRFSGWYYIIIV